MNAHQLIALDRHFAAGGSLTPLEAIEAPFRCMSLSQRCGQLRRDYAKPVVSAWETLPTGKRVKRYRYVQI